MAIDPDDLPTSLMWGKKKRSMLEKNAWTPRAAAAKAAPGYAKRIDAETTFELTLDLSQALGGANAIAGEICVARAHMGYAEWMAAMSAGGSRREEASWSKAFLLAVAGICTHGWHRGAWRGMSSQGVGIRFAKAAWLAAPRLRDGLAQAGCPGALFSELPHASANAEDECHVAMSGRCVEPERPKGAPKARLSPPQRAALMRARVEAAEAFFRQAFGPAAIVESSTLQAKDAPPGLKALRSCRERFELQSAQPVDAAPRGEASRL